MNNSDIEKPQIRWRCKRGMLELDLILLSFFDKNYDNLSDELKLQFQQLLQCTDPEIYAWLLNIDETTDKELVAIVQYIRSRM